MAWRGVARRGVVRCGAAQRSAAWRGVPVGRQARMRWCIRALGYLERLGDALDTGLRPRDHLPPELGHARTCQCTLTFSCGHAYMHVWLSQACVSTSVEEAGIEETGIEEYSDSTSPSPAVAFSPRSP